MTALDDVARAIQDIICAGVEASDMHARKYQFQHARKVSLAILRAYLSSEPSAREIEATAKEIERQAWTARNTSQDSMAYENRRVASLRKARRSLVAARRAALTEIEQESG